MEKILEQNLKRKQANEKAISGTKSQDRDWQQDLPAVPLDSIYQLETPEGVELSLHVAGPVVRFLAFLIDFGIRLAMQIIVVVVLSLFQKSGTWLMLIIFFLLEWFYPVFFEITRNGKTPGKMLMGLQVIMQNGTPVNWDASILRNLLRAADGFILTYSFGLLTMMLTKGFKRLGDLAAGTIVIYAKETYLMTIPRSWQTKIEIRPLPPVVSLNLEEQVALVSYAGRIAMLGPERADELARIVSEALDNTTVQEKNPVSLLLAMAAWVKGQALPQKGQTGTA